MTAADIIKRLKDLDFDKNNYRGLTGTAMVLYGIKTETPDIDLGCTKQMADVLSQEYDVTIMPDGTKRFKIDDDIEIFEDWLSGEVILLNDIPIVSLEGLIAMKEALGRDKDQKDIALIRKFMHSRQGIKK